MRFERFINEALKPSQFRMYVKGWNKEYLKELFNGKYRIYLDMHQVKEENPQPSDIQKRVARQLEPDFYIENYVAGLCKKRGDDKNLYKIGKVLTKIVELGSTLPDRFANDPIRQAHKKTSIMVVISRHPYDIAGMSTDRGWTSCMTLKGDKERPEDGENCNYIEGEIKDGAIIAYLINKNDPNITKPIARMLLKSYFNERDPSKKILVSGQIYGTNIPGFKETVDAWLDKQAKEIGLYRLSSNTYHDVGYPNTKLVGETEEIIERIKYNIQRYNPKADDLETFLRNSVLNWIYHLIKQVRKEPGYEALKKVKGYIKEIGLKEFLHEQLSSNKLHKAEFIKGVYAIVRSEISDYMDLDQWVVLHAFPVNTVYYLATKMGPFATIDHNNKAEYERIFNEHLDIYNEVGITQQRKDELLKIFKLIYLGVQE